MKLVDQYGRRMRKLRISLTDKCNLRCNYCMPLNSKFMDENNFLNQYQIVEIARELYELGLEEVRLTGGEPLMRSDFSQIVDQLAEIPFKKLGLTTNAVKLAPFLPQLKKAHFQYLNISLDSLHADRFKKITHGKQLSAVMNAIEKASAMGFKVKVNMVAMRGINDDEFFDFIALAEKLNFEIRFLELMKIGYVRKQQQNLFISAQDIISQLKTRMNLTASVTSDDSTSFNYVNENGVKIGFIASESQAFCATCSRWRLSADGILRGCLFKNEGLSLKNKTAEERKVIYTEVLKMKPFVRPESVSQVMNTIGG